MWHNPARSFFTYAIVYRFFFRYENFQEAHTEAQTRSSLSLPACPAPNGPRLVTLAPDRLLIWSSESISILPPSSDPPAPQGPSSTPPFPSSISWSRLPGVGRVILDCAARKPSVTVVCEGFQLKIVDWDSRKWCSGGFWPVVGRLCMAVSPREEEFR